MTPKSHNVFENLRGYGFVHHRALNSPQSLNRAVNLVRKHPTRSHIMEGDICWHETNEEVHLYFRHPNFIVDTPRLSRIKHDLQNNRLVGLEDLDQLKDTSSALIIELKIGRGNWRRSLSTLVDYLENNFQGRYWIDGFSLPMLKFVKKVYPSTPVTLHTEFVYKSWVLVGAPEWPPLQFRKLDQLDFVDGIAIRWRFGKRFMAQSCKDVQDAGKYLVISRLHNLEQFECSKKWNAVAGYMHWDFESLLAVNDMIEAEDY